MNWHGAALTMAGVIGSRVVASLLWIDVGVNKSVG